MGGFKLIGPRFVFENVPSESSCYCAGYIGAIDYETEESLLRANDRVMRWESMPRDLAAEVQRHHLGDSSNFTVRPKTGEDVVPVPYDARGDISGVEAYHEIFAPFALL